VKKTNKVNIDFIVVTDVIRSRQTGFLADRDDTRLVKMTTPSLRSERDHVRITPSLKR